MTFGLNIASGTSYSIPLRMALTNKIVPGNIQWIDVTEPSAEEMDELSAKFQLNQHTVRDCLQPEHLPKYEHDEDSNVHFLILRFYAQGLEKNMASIQELTDKIAIFYTDQFLLTIHKANNLFIDSIASRYASRATSTSELLSRIVWQALETYDSPAEQLSSQVDMYEDQILLKKVNNDQTKALYHIKKQASSSHKMLMLMLEPINHIPVQDADTAIVQDVRDQHLKMQTLYGQILEEVNNLLNLSMSLSAQRTNEVMRILTLFSVFFMPLTFIVGIYGMNFEFMPELKQKWGYPAVLILMALVAAAIYSWFKRKRWL